MTTDSILSRSRVRGFVLRKLASMRPDLTRVSGAVIDQYEAYLRAIIVEDIKRHPSRGKTFTESFTMECQTAKSDGNVR